jgi:2-amino-4-hydroxy-6-hydroxymethyldihydropteridine diphosphokinase
MENSLYLSFGSNIGDRENNIKKALSLIQDKFSLIKLSSFYNTHPVGYLDQPDFLNCASYFKSTLSHEECLDFINHIENILGRIRKIKNGPRIIDIDIIYFNNEVYESARLIIPHPRMHERFFVLEPLFEIGCDVKHPILSRTVRELIDSL